MSEERTFPELLRALAANQELVRLSRRRFIKATGTVAGLAAGSSALAWLIEADCGLL